MSEPSQDAPNNPQSNDSDDESSNPTGMSNEVGILPILMEERDTDLKQSVCDDSSTSKQSSISTLKDKISSKSKESSSERIPDFELTPAQASFSYLKVKTTTKAKKDIDFFWSCLAQRFYEEDSKPEKKPLLSTESRERTSSFKPGKKFKPKFHKRAKSSEIRKNDESFKSSEEKSGERILSELVAAIQDLKIPEKKEFERPSVGESATASLETDNQSLFLSAKEDVDFYFRFFKEANEGSSTTDSTGSSTIASTDSSSTKSAGSSDTASTDSGTLTPDSDDSESKSRKHQSMSLEKQSLNIPFINSRFNDANVSLTLWELYDKCMIREHAKLSKFPEPPMESFVFQRCSKSNLLEPCIKLRLSQSFEELKLPDPVPVVESKAAENHWNLSFKKPNQSAELRESVSPVAFRPKKIVRSKQPLPTLKSKQLDPSVRSKSGFPPKSTDFSYSDSAEEVISGTKFDLVRYEHEIKLGAFISIRRSHILKIRHIAARVKAFMETIEILKSGYPDDDEVIHVQWNMQDAADWINVLYHWDVVKEDVNIMSANIDIIYDELYNWKVLPTTRQFRDFMDHFICVYENVSRLYWACKNGLPKCTKFCSPSDGTKFFDYASALIAHVLFLLENLEEEVPLIERHKRINKY